jgi:dTDP-4-dehydrorhamnose reductase
MDCIVLLGGSGQLGRDIKNVLSNSYEIFAPSHNLLNVTDHKSLHRFLDDSSPDIVINCTAYHDVIGCELDPKRAHQLNTEVVKNLVEESRINNFKLVHFSTDYVFDGKTSTPYCENDKTNPINEYGRSKVAGEQVILDKCDEYVIGRVSSLFGSKGSSNKGLNFIERVIQSEWGMKVVDDQIMSPSYTIDVTHGIKFLLHNHKSGIFHINNSGGCSWFELANYIKEKMDLSIEITPIKLKELGVNVLTPKYSVMASSVLCQPSWKDGVDNYLRSRLLL